MQNCLFTEEEANTVYLQVSFAIPTDLVNVLAYSTGGDPTLITAFDSAGNVIGGAGIDPFGSNPGWGFGTISAGDGSMIEGNPGISTLLIGGTTGTHQGINEIAYASIPLSAPEIDTTSAASGLTLLLGGLMVLRGRRVRA
jgi:hypothetical protein